MTTTETYRLLILVESQNEAERLISLFRNAGHAVRAHRVTSEQDLQDHLNDHWDLMICDGKHPDLDMAQARQLFKSAELDIPVLLLAENVETATILAGFEQGAQDVIHNEADPHLLLAAQREIFNARERSQKHIIEAELSEATQRAEQLLGDSQDAIAYVADGMHIEANEAYSQIFGYEDQEEFECLPIIDLVAAKDQDRFKAFLRHYSKGETDQAELGFVGLRNDDTEFNAYMVLSPSSFDGEACTQVLIRQETDSAGSAAATSTTDALTGLYSRQYLLDQLATSAIQAGSGVSASLAFISLDNSAHFLSSVGLSACDALIKDLAELLADQVTEGDCLARFGDTSLALLIHNKTPEEALAFAHQCCKAVEEHICEALKQTVQYTVSIGIAPLSARNVNEVVDQAYSAVLQIREQDNNNDAEIYVTKAVQIADSGGAAASLEEAIEQNQFRLLFQPIISLRGDSREHYEVSLRMLDEHDKEIPPSEFLASATDTKLDRWVILEATKMLSLHRADDHDTRIIINLTANALLDKGLPPWINVAMKAASLPVDSVVFQFSEVDISKHLKVAKEATQALNDLGCKVSMGQFGRTVDPIKTLKHVSVDYVKIDGSFTLDLQENQGDPQVLKALINSIAENNMLSIVPCVENAGVLATLWQVGVNYIQGHYLQSPSPSMDYEFTEIA